ncbi:MAG: hypothetical protein IKH81_05360 [Clostridia bacterium]|nr:hypothetical protein [Clostridia bacterium]
MAEKARFAYFQAIYAWNKRISADTILFAGFGLDMVNLIHQINNFMIVFRCVKKLRKEDAV